MDVDQFIMDGGSSSIFCLSTNLSYSVQNIKTKLNLLINYKYSE
jgi:hypothetical protein